MSVVSSGVGETQDISLIIVLVLIKELSPTQAVEELKEAEEEAPAAVTPADDGEEI